MNDWTPTDDDTSGQLSGDGDPQPNTSFSSDANAFPTPADDPDLWKLPSRRKQSAPGADFALPTPAAPPAPVVPAQPPTPAAPPAPVVPAQPPAPPPAPVADFGPPASRPDPYESERIVSSVTPSDYFVDPYDDPRTGGGRWRLTAIVVLVVALLGALGFGGYTFNRASQWERTAKELSSQLDRSEKDAKDLEKKVNAAANRAAQLEDDLEFAQQSDEFIADFYKLAASVLDSLDACNTANRDASSTLANAVGGSATAADAQAAAAQAGIACDKAATDYQELADAIAAL